MKNMKKNGIILTIITIIVLVLVLKDDFSNIVNLLSTANAIYILIAILLEIIFLFFESLAFDQILKSYDEKFKLKKSFSITVITKFFNGITPFSSGGQPMQVYMLKKEGFRITKATNAIMQNFILYQFALITFGVISIFINYSVGLFPKNELLGNLVTLGFAVNTLVMVVLLVVSFSNKFNKFLTSIMIKVLSKLKIVKNKDKQIKSWEEKCNDFHEGATYIINHKWLCIKGFVYYIIAFIAFYSMPLVIIKALSTENIELMSSIVASSYVMIIGSFVPIPGASGGIEYGYLSFFKYLINSNGLISASLIIWRSITYYLPMVAGAILFNLGKGKAK